MFKLTKNEFDLRFLDRQYIKIFRNIFRYVINLWVKYSNIKNRILQRLRKCVYCIVYFYYYFEYNDELSYKKNNRTDKMFYVYFKVDRIILKLKPSYL